ncbi:MAG TPA: class I SAM-dependent methyltransferase family protein [Candidatus Bilamarchaeaceae archaeon]|nr:class I SAM-dependent methyltransferase family protein [Candidatus Bilamarchaeaceae archaeon]
MVSILDLLSSQVPKARQPYLPRSYDLLGSIAIVDIKPEVRKYSKKIAQAILELHKPVRTVLQKASAMHGTYRVRKLKWLAGEKTTETAYKEHGVNMRLDVAKTYFSVRLSNERLRIAERVKPGENVLVFFAGVGPFALVIAKKQPRCSVIGIELNPHATRYFKENVLLNKLQNCTAVKGDVKRLARKYKGWAHRILMPLPKGAEDFLDAAFLAAKHGCVVHFYQFAKAEDPFGDAKKKILDAAKRNRCRVKILNEKTVRPYAPKIVQVCVDFKKIRVPTLR